MDSNTSKTKIVGPCDKGRLVGQKLPLKHVKYGRSANGSILAESGRTRKHVRL
jgi:hypothetical protein